MRIRMEQLKQRLRKQSGFTLIELMATLGILALIVAIAVPAIGSIMNDAEKGSKKASIAMIEEAAALAELGDEAPTSTKTATKTVDGEPVDVELNKYSTKDLVDSGYLDISTDSKNELYGATVMVVEQLNGSYTLDESTIGTTTP